MGMRACIALKHQQQGRDVDKKMKERFQNTAVGYNLNFTQHYLRDAITTGVTSSLLSFLYHIMWGPKVFKLIVLTLTFPLKYKRLREMGRFIGLHSYLGKGFRLESGSLNSKS